jgi:hypothetical protein
MCCENNSYLHEVTEKRPNFIYSTNNDKIRHFIELNYTYIET